MGGKSYLQEGFVVNKEVIADTTNFIFVSDEMQRSDVIFYLEGAAPLSRKKRLNCI